MSIRLQQRFSRAQPCPVCGGYDRLARGTGVRCYGFVSDDGSYAHCTREEFAGPLERNPASQAFAHKLEGPCGCGHSHGAAKPGPTEGSTGRQLLRTWDYWNAEGSQRLYQVCRYEKPQGKTYGVRRPAPAG